MLFPVVVAVAGCLPRPAPSLPADLWTAFGRQATITLQTPPAGTTGQDIVAALRAQELGGMFHGHAVPVFGVVDCHGDPGCQAGPGGTVGGPARTVWMVLYPGCINADGTSTGWVIVDAVNGLESGYIASEPCDN